MSDAKISKKIMTFAVIGAALFMSALRCAVVITKMEKNLVDENAYYLPGGKAVTAFALGTLAVCLAFTAVSFRIGRRKISVYDTSNVPSSAAGLTYAFTLICLAALYVYFVISGRLQKSVAEIILAVVTLASGLFYFMRFGAKNRSAEKLAVPALLPIIYCAVRLLSEFMQKSAAPMESSGAYHILSLAAALLFFFAEGRSLVGPQSLSLYLAYGSVSTILLLIYAIPNLVIHGLGLLEFDYYAFTSLGDIFMAAYICARMISCGVAPKAAEESGESPEAKSA